MRGVNVLQHIFILFAMALIPNKNEVWTFVMRCCNPSWKWNVLRFPFVFCIRVNFLFGTLLFPAVPNPPPLPQVCRSLCPTRGLHCPPGERRFCFGSRTEKRERFPLVLGVSLSLCLFCHLRLNLSGGCGPGRCRLPKLRGEILLSLERLKVLGFSRTWRRKSRWTRRKREPGDPGSRM